MARIKENTRYNVVSMRIGEEELRYLKDMMEKSHNSVSHIMREALEFFAANHKEENSNRTAA